MLIFNIISHGGMTRLIESLIDINLYLPKGFPLKIVIFSPHPTFHQDKNFHWIKWDSNDPSSYSKSNIERIHNLLVTEFKGVEIDLVIGDVHSLIYWEKFDVPFCYDVHFLDQPFYTALKNDPEIFFLDEISPLKISRRLLETEIFSVKREAKFMSRSIAFIANSKSSESHLKEYYAPLVKDKIIRRVPISTDFKKNLEINPINKSLFYSGRFHPQKGIHKLFLRKKTQLPIFFRGVSESHFYAEYLEKLKLKNLHFLNWESSRKLLEKELEAYTFCLFPSIYEPWGLSLQESLAAGRICVASKSHSGHEEQINHNVNGFLIDFKNDYWEDEIDEILNLPKSKLIEISHEASNSKFFRDDFRLKTLGQVLEELEAST